MSATEDTLTLLRSIDASLKALVSVATKRQAAQQQGVVATDRDLDGKYGDPVLRFLPRDWSGSSFKQRKFSECPPELLDLVSETLEYFGRQADEKGETTEKGKPVGDYKRQDAARARGWAKRIRAGTHRQEPTTAPEPTEEWAGDDGAWT